MSFVQKLSTQSIKNFRKNVFGNIYFYVIGGIISFIVAYLYKIEILKTIGTVFISASIFKFLLTGNEFLEIIKDEISKILLYDENIFLDKLPLKEKEEIIKKLYDKIRKEKKEIAIKKAKDFYFLQKKNSNFKKNFIVQESFRTDTIYSNGNVISSYKFIVEIMDDGNFEFSFKYKTDNEKINMPKMESFKNKNRFNDFSFDLKLLNYNGEDPKNTINMKIEKDDNKEKELLFFINGTKQGDIITFMFSISCPGEYDEDLIKDIKNGDKTSGGTYNSIHAIRNIIYQIENYENKAKKIPLEPILVMKKDKRDNDKIINPNKTKIDIYYKRYYWKIYSYDSDLKILELKLN